MIQLHRPALGGAYVSVATPHGDHGRYLATAVLGPWGWSVAYRDRKRRFRQEWFSTRTEAEEALVTLGLRRMTAVIA